MLIAVYSWNPLKFLLVVLSIITWKRDQRVLPVEVPSVWCSANRRERSWSDPQQQCQADSRQRRSRTSVSRQLPDNETKRKFKF
jgi:hypothetical protein